MTLMVYVLTLYIHIYAINVTLLFSSSKGEFCISGVTEEQTHVSLCVLSTEIAWTRFDGTLRLQMKDI